MILYGPLEESFERLDLHSPAAILPAHRRLPRRFEIGQQAIGFVRVADVRIVDAAQDVAGLE